MGLRRIKEGRKQRFKDDEEALSWVKQTLCEIDKFWSQLANAMEEEVLFRDRQFSDVRKCSAAEGVDPAEDVE